MTGIDAIHLSTLAVGDSPAPANLLTTALLWLTKGNAATVPAAALTVMALAATVLVCPSAVSRWLLRMISNGIEALWPIDHRPTG